MRDSLKKPKRFFRPSLQTLEDRLAPSGTPFGPLHGYDGTWDANTGALWVNVAQADGALAGDTLAIATIAESGNQFVTINGDTTAIKTNEVRSLSLSDADSPGITFDLGEVTSIDFSAFTSDVSVNGFVGDTLKVNDTPRLWSIDAANGGTATGADYNVLFSNLGTINAGAGADTFAFQDGASLTGAIDGGTGADNAFDFSNYTSNLIAQVNGTHSGSITTAGNAFHFTNIQNLTGGVGTNTYDFADGGALTNLDGGSGANNTLDFADTSNSAIDADITGTNAGSVAATVTFTDIQTLNGSSAGGDTYTIEDGANLGAIHGGAANDNTLIYSASTSMDVAMDLQAMSATGVGVFSHIDTAVVNATGATYTLTGDNSAIDWNITSANAGNIDDGKFNFSGFTVLNAGNGGDAFNVNPNVVFTGAINGGVGIDTLTFDSNNQTVTLTTVGDNINGFTGAADSVSDGFTAIDILVGTGNNNTLNGENTPANWNLADPDNQYVTNGDTLTFNNFQNLNGGSGTDSFACYGDFTGTLNGGTGLATFAFLGSATLTGDIVGNSGNDTLDYSNYDLAIAVTLTGDNTAGFSGVENAGSISGTFSNINRLIGSGDDADSLTGEDVDATWNLALPSYTYSTGADTLNFSNIFTVNGGAGADSFNVGSTLASNNGTLDNVSSPLTIEGGGRPDGQRDTLYLNDHGTIGRADYVITPTSIESDSATTSRPFAGVNYSDIDFLQLDGTDDINVFNVTPSFTTEIDVNGNLPSFSTAHPGGGNVLHVDTTGATLHITSPGAGYWDFTSGEMRVDFTNIGGPPPVSIIAIGANPGGLPTVKVLNAATGALLFQFVAYENYFRGGVRVAVADVNGDGIPDIIAAPGPKHSPLIKIYTGSLDVHGNYRFTLAKSFYAFTQTFLGGVYVAAGDINHDGIADVVVGAGAGWLPQVKVYNGLSILTTQHLIGVPFNAFTSAYRGGVVVAVADVNNDGYADIIATPVSLTINLENDFSGNGLTLLRSGRRLRHN